MPIPTRVVTVDLFALTGAAVPSGMIRLTLLREDVYSVDSTVIVPAGATSATMGADGKGTISVFPNALGTHGTAYQVDVFNALGVHVFPEPGRIISAYVPDANCLLQDVAYVSPQMRPDDMFFVVNQAREVRDILAVTRPLAQQANADAATIAAGIAAAANNATLAANSAAAAASSASSASSSSASALTASATSGAYPNGATTVVPRGLTQASVGAITAGSGGTNGSYTNGTTTGGNFLIAPTFNYTVAGGVLTSVTITGPGLCLNAAPNAGTPSFPGSNLVGANVALTPQFLITAGNGYWAQSADGLTLDRYKNVGGLATRDTSIQSIALLTSTGALSSPAVPGAEHATQDSNDNASEYIEPATGKRYVNALDADSVNGIPRSELRRAARRGLPAFTATYVAVISYGQSLSVGANAQIHTRPDVDGGFFGAVRFNANGSTTAGPRAQEGSGTVAQNHASFVAYEEQFNVSSLGETPLGNHLRMVKRLLRDENGIGPSDYEYIFVGSAPGQSNTAIAPLSKGGSLYQRVIDDVTYGKQIANGLGKSYAVDVIDWSQGEADSAAGTARATYAAALQQLWTDLNTDIKAITGQLHDVKLIMYQMSWGAQTNNTIALAQLDAAKANPSNIIIATASYAEEHFAATDAHLTGFGYASLGAYYGLCHKRVVLDGEAWPLLYPQNLRRQKNGTILEFDMPDTGYPWTISSALFPTVANAGFTATRADGFTDNPITSVTVVGPRRVRVVLTFAEGGKLRYGFSSWGGNLHDTTDIDPGTAAAGLLYRPALTCEEPFA